MPATAWARESVALFWLWARAALSQQPAALGTEVKTGELPPFRFSKWNPRGWNTSLLISDVKKLYVFWSFLCNWYSYTTNTYLFKPHKCQAVIGKTNRPQECVYENLFLGERCLYLQSDVATNRTSKSQSFYACTGASGLILTESERAGMLRRKRVSVYTSNTPETSAKSFSWSASSQRRQQLSFCCCSELCWNTIYWLAPTFRKIDVSLFTQ